MKYKAGAPTQSEFIVLPSGEYDFVISAAIECVTDKASAKLAAGTGKLELKLRVNDEATVFDRCFITESAFWKIDSLLMSIGQHPGEGEEIEFDAAELVGGTGRVYIKRVAITRDGKETDEYKNEVGSYLWDKDAPPRKRNGLDAVRGARAAGASQAPLVDAVVVDDDGIPF